MNSTRIIPLLLAVACISGCADQPEMARSSHASAAKKYSNEELLRAVKDANRAAAAATPPQPTIMLPEANDWVRTEPRPLPPEEHGFTVAYDHPSGLSVTLYQFTLGLSVIPDDLSAGPVQNAMTRAKAGIEQAVQLGYWQAAQETDHGIVRLGDSAKQAIWCRHLLTVNGHTAPSDTYVWSHNNTLFKLRCTGRSRDSEAEGKALSELLTALGDACRSGAR